MIYWSMGTFKGHKITSKKIKIISQCFRQLYYKIDLLPTVTNSQHYTALSTAHPIITPSKKIQINILLMMQYKRSCTCSHESCAR
jgi:hypothetical protein